MAMLSANQNSYFTLEFETEEIAFILEGFSEFRDASFSLSVSAGVLPVSSSQTLYFKDVTAYSANMLSAAKITYLQIHQQRPVHINATD
jgi:hypothetical protein